MEKYYELLDNTYQKALEDAIHEIDSYCLHLINKSPLPQIFDQNYKG